MRLFSERGFRGTTTKEIAQAAGVSEAIIFRHFATKEDLYTAIIDHKGCGGARADSRPGTLSRPSSSTRYGAASPGRSRPATTSQSSAASRSTCSNITRAIPSSSAADVHRAQESLARTGLLGRNVRVLYEFLGGYVRRRQREAPSAT